MRGVADETTRPSSRSTTTRSSASRGRGGRVDEGAVEVGGDEARPASVAPPSCVAQVTDDAAAGCRPWSGSGSTGTPRSAARTSRCSSSVVRSGRTSTFHGRRRSSTRVVSPTPGFTRLASAMPKRSWMRGDARGARPRGRGGPRGRARPPCRDASATARTGRRPRRRTRSRRPRPRAPGTTWRRGTRPGPSTVVVEHRAAHQPRDGGVEAGAGHQEVVAGAEQLGAVAGVGEDGERGVEAAPSLAAKSWQPAPAR